MLQTCDIRVHPDALNEETLLKEAAARKLDILPGRITQFRILRRSVDARKGKPWYQLRLEVWLDEKPKIQPPVEPVFRDVRNAAPVYIAGLGPAGLFAALQLIASGRRPVVIERGKPVPGRRRDIARLNREGIVNPESNYCFGEGGAGTFSDGKLYTRSTKRGDTREVLELLHAFGASEDILIDAHPHIGTNRLPKIIQQMREFILSCGGEVHFETSLSGIEIQNGRLTAIILNGTDRLEASSLILATGHSARDIFHMIHQSGIGIEAKPFALGVRVEHPQALVDSIQYHCKVRHPNLPAASYNLTGQAWERGVYSFCMCPGGIICPSTTSEEAVVVNGWSPSKRNSPFANSGIVTELSLADIPGVQENPLAGLAYQERIEHLAFIAGGGRQKAPAQRLTDFVSGKISRDLPACSYIPGIVSADLKEVLPAEVRKRLTEGFRIFGGRMKGFLTQEAVVTAVESRTSSPVRIPRDPKSLMHPKAEGLFPCGEGAGYAGGIMSAAIDGRKVAEAVGVFETR